MNDFTIYFNILLGTLALINGTIISVRLRNKDRFNHLENQIKKYTDKGYLNLYCGFQTCSLAIAPIYGIMAGSLFVFLTGMFYLIVNTLALLISNDRVIIENL